MVTTAELRSTPRYQRSLSIPRSQPSQPSPSASPEQQKDYERALRDYESQQKINQAYEATVAEYGRGYVSSKIINKYDLTRREQQQLITMIRGAASAEDIKTKQGFVEQRLAAAKKLVERPELKEVQVGSTVYTKEMLLRGGELVSTTKTSGLQKPEPQELINSPFDKSRRDLTITNLQQQVRQGNAPKQVTFGGETLNVSSLDTRTPFTTFVSASKEFIGEKVAKDTKNILNVLFTDNKTSTVYYYDIPKGTMTSQYFFDTGKGEVVSTPNYFNKTAYTTNVSENIIGIRKALAKGIIDIATFAPVETITVGGYIAEGIKTEKNLLKGYAVGSKEYVLESPGQTFGIALAGVGPLFKQSYFVSKEARATEELIRRQEQINKLMPQVQKNLAAQEAELARIRQQRIKLGLATGGEDNIKITSASLGNQQVLDTKGVSQIIKEIKSDKLITEAEKNALIDKITTKQASISATKVVLSPKDTIETFGGSLGDIKQTIRLPKIEYSPDLLKAEANIYTLATSEADKNVARSVALQFQKTNTGMINPRTIKVRIGTTNIKESPKKTFVETFSPGVNKREVVRTDIGDFIVDTKRTMTKEPDILVSKISEKTKKIGEVKVITTKTRQKVLESGFEVRDVGEGNLIRSQRRTTIPKNTLPGPSTKTTTTTIIGSPNKVVGELDLMIGQEGTTSFGKLTLTSGKESKVFSTSQTFGAKTNVPKRKIQRLGEVIEDVFKPRRAMKPFTPTEKPLSLPEPQQTTTTQILEEPKPVKVLQEEIIQETEQRVVSVAPIGQPIQAKEMINVPSYIDMKGTYSPSGTIFGTTAGTTGTVIIEETTRRGTINTKEPEIVTDVINKQLMIKEPQIKIGIKDKIDFGNKRKNFFKDKVFSNIKIDQNLNDEVRDKIKQEDRNKVLQISKQNLRQQQRTRQITEQITNQIGERVFNEQPRINDNIPTTFNFELNTGKPSKTAKKKETTTSDFEVFIRKRGQDISIGKALTKEQAVGKLVSRLKGTVAASGFIETEGRKVKTQNLGLTLGGEFITGKKEQFRLVQRKERRLGTGQEVKELGYFKKGKRGKFL